MMTKEYYDWAAARRPAPENAYVVPDYPCVVCCSDLPKDHAGYIHAEAALSAAGFHYNIGWDAWMREAT